MTTAESVVALASRMEAGFQHLNHRLDNLMNLLDNTNKASANLLHDMSKANGMDVALKLEKHVPVLNAQLAEMLALMDQVSARWQEMATEPIAEDLANTQGQIASLRRTTLQIRRLLLRNGNAG